jgi:isopentenyl phosphate kinase
MIPKIQAAKNVAQQGIQVIIMNGDTPENIKNALNGGEFVGTTITKS